MSTDWTPEQLAQLDAAHELDIAVRRADGTLRPWTPIWAVRVDSDVYVRTWYRRDTGWFGLALRTGRARVRVPGVEADVRIEDVGVGPSSLRKAVDDACRAKYGARRLDRKHGRRRSRSDDAWAAQLLMEPSACLGRRLRSRNATTG